MWFYWIDKDWLGTDNTTNTRIKLFYAFFLFSAQSMRDCLSSALSSL